LEDEPVKAAELNFVGKLEIVGFADVGLDADGGSGLGLATETGDGAGGVGINQDGVGFILNAFEFAFTVVVDQKFRGGEELGVGVGFEGVITMLAMRGLSRPKVPPGYPRG